MQFYKYQGTGNDFVIIDDREEKFNTKDIVKVKKICNRKYGIGADGLILLRNHVEFDFHMIYFNADGSQSFCGNGSRCCVKFAASLQLFTERTTFLSTDGVHEAELMSNGDVALQMHDVNQIKALGLSNYEIDTGSPHYIRFVEDLRKEDMVATGRSIRYSPPYSDKGINVNLVEVDANKNECIQMQTYERGVEDETLSCGTGVTAAALVHAHINSLEEKIKVNTKGGQLVVKFTKDREGCFKNIYLIGPAEKVFEGKWEM